MILSHAKQFVILAPWKTASFPLHPDQINARLADDFTLFDYLKIAA